jgi:NAD(P)-dependent dehydrogenase (short-subunit alcohol dehydrogenase family)
MPRQEGARKGMRNMDFFGLSGRNALVLGGGLGMGESAAIRLAQAGANVAIVDIDPDRAERVAGQVRALGRNGVVVTGDIFDLGQVETIVNAATAHFGALHILVTVPGHASWGSYLDMTEDDWNVDHHKNLRYFAMFAQAAIQRFVDSGEGGTIVGIASVDGIHGAPRHAAYGAAKAGMIQLVKSLAVEFASKNIRVNAVAPGSIMTTKFLGSPTEQPYREKIKGSLIPIKRPGTPDEIGDAVLFLASRMSSYVTGQTLAVDGGWTAANLLEAY